VGDAIRETIAGGGSTAAQAEVGSRLSYEPMLLDGIEKLAAAETSLEELERVVSWNR
jgi:type II secretory ATPase GspE/PulE/Tfp pilus assembly ATPase PilB-like protein